MNGLSICCVCEASQHWHANLSYAEGGTIVEIVLLDAKKKKACCRMSSGKPQNTECIRSHSHILMNNTGCHSTTLVDYYALPQTGTKAWPGRAAANELHHDDKACTVQDTTLEVLARHLGMAKQELRFVPYVVMHEFEAMLFSDCTSFAEGTGRKDLGAEFQKIRDQFATPEQINDSPQTAPSKRVEKLVPGYQKPFLGNLAALDSR